MKTTDKFNVQAVVEGMVSAGVEHVVLCPGSRNAPLLIAVSRDERLKSDVVIDERSAAFIALGIAIQTERPVAVVCTSGSAVLNFAPAVAEAYYRRVPLIVISADRPDEWIDQDDSQTIRQRGILDNIVKKSCHLDDITPYDSVARHRQIIRQVVDTLYIAKAGPSGPVHINIEMDEPLNHVSEPVQIPLISIHADMTTWPEEELALLAREINNTSRVMIVCGFMSPNPLVSDSLKKLATRDNIVVLAEAQANVRAPGVINNVDTVLRAVKNKRDDLAPELVVTVGGALLSRHVKTWMRTIKGLKHWHIGVRDMSVDPFLALVSRIEDSPINVLPDLISALTPVDSDYRLKCQQMAHEMIEQGRRYIEDSPWSDLKAVSTLVDSLEPSINVHVSNGTAIRYVQLCDSSRLGRVECNRGVSGIDGATSTAIGSSSVYNGTTLLLTGDMSAQYDMGALASTLVDHRFKMAVLNNAGGGIFRFIDTTRSLPELERCFAADVRLPLRQLAEGFGFDYFCASSLDELDSVLPSFLAPSLRPAILDLQTPPDLSARVITSYFKSIE
ncbi:MAG: 2-succinyl-5-enolpyruvyl-6-hydroxy-3-cyclohexene-1-carboxylic-acid synthase [Muribaculaceae bacterium]|nr:2-succinyl-5-enolpyruvyl-6-hydroxy-3-cyclohexene-1-carboxylic-acid synthase [Muribaculaceae bacterium]